MNLTIKRILLVIISLALGFGATHLSLFLMNTTPAEYGLYFGTDGDGLAYYPLTVLFFALFFALWVDKFLGTDMLPK